MDDAFSRRLVVTIVNLCNVSNTIERLLFILWQLKRQWAPGHRACTPPHSDLSYLVALPLCIVLCNFLFLYGWFVSLWSQSVSLCDLSSPFLVVLASSWLIDWLPHNTCLFKQRIWPKCPLTPCAGSAVFLCSRQLYLRICCFTVILTCAYVV